MKLIIYFIVIPTLVVSFVGYFFYNEYGFDWELFPESETQKEMENNENQPNDQQTQYPQDVQFYKDLDKGIFIVKFSKDRIPSLFFDSSVENRFAEITTKENFNIAVNAGYFTEDFSHAGLLKIDGVINTPLAYNDTQLTHIVDLNSGINFVPTSDFHTNSQSSSAFQTGPLVLNNGVIQTSLIQNSLNGSGEYRRSFLGFNNTEIFIGIARNTISLNDLGNEILGLDFFTDKNISLINLDGGSSVALYVEGNSEFIYGENKKLPAILGIKF